MGVLMRVAYDGTGYAGFQRQANALTVQERMEGVLQEVAGCTARVTGASRTDAGVHARGQLVCWNVARCPIPLERLPVVLNRRLPADIRVLAARPVPPGYDPRRQARSKTYSYTIWLGEAPTEFRWMGRVWTVSSAGNLVALNQLAARFLGRHDFRAFRGEGSSAQTTTREIYAAYWVASPPRRVFWVTGNGFLYHMVRMMVAGMVDAVSTGDETRIVAALQHPSTEKMVKLAPAAGLCLEEIDIQGGF